MSTVFEHHPPEQFESVKYELSVNPALVYIKPG